MKILVSWIGTADLDASKAGSEANLGPVANALKAIAFDRVLLLANQPPAELKAYERWLGGRAATEIDVRRVVLDDPTDLTRIHEIVTEVLDEVRERFDGAELAFHLSPGTWAMAAVWSILSATRFPAQLLQSSKERGVQVVQFPFELAAEFLPTIFGADRQEAVRTEPWIFWRGLRRHCVQSSSMLRLGDKAKKAANRSFTTLIMGEAGTEAPALARMIHSYGARSSEAFVAIDCAALEGELQIDTIFGGADAEGILCARGGTLFLENVEHLSLGAQRRLSDYLEATTNIPARPEPPGSSHLPAKNSLKKSRAGASWKSSTTNSAFLCSRSAAARKAGGPKRSDRCHSRHHKQAVRA